MENKEFKYKIFEKNNACWTYSKRGKLRHVNKYGYFIILTPATDFNIFSIKWSQSKKHYKDEFINL